MSVERAKGVRRSGSASFAELPVAELEVLACLWRRGPSSAREVRHAMAAYRPMTHGAMVTLLKRLEEKRLVAKTKAATGKAFIYRAVHAPEPTYSSLMGRIRQRIFGGNVTSMVASLFESGAPDAEELAELEAMVVRLRASQRPSSKERKR